MPNRLPFAAGKFSLTMGLSALGESEWFEIDDHLGAALAAKRRLLDRRHNEVFLALPEAVDSARALLALMASHLPLHHPAIYRATGQGLFNQATGESWDLAAPLLHPLDLAGRLVPEDLCIMLPLGEEYRLVGASLCAPSRWLLAEKIGQPLAAIHAPVPGYGGALERPVDRFFASLKPGRLVGRSNWGLIDDPAPFQPIARPVSDEVTAHNAGEKLWLRVERQTLCRLAETAAVIFTIRTRITRLDRVITSSSAALALAASIRDMSPEMRRYKTIAGVIPALLAWLETRGRMFECNEAVG